tara:strand:+ start:958 stop:1956 length:999 start_codon:yes stop_codon:yes gene_type:complete
MKKVFVTGSSGFIGSHLVERLLKLGYKVKALVPYNINNNWGWLDNIEKSSLKEIEVISGDICDYNFILKETKKIDLIFHLAALISIPYSYESPRSYISTNVDGTLNILEAGKLNNVKKIVNTSTSEVYGSAQKIPINENHPLNAQSPYAATKISADQLTMSYYRSFDLPVTILRPFNTFGPRQSLRAAIPTIISQIVLGKKEIKLGNLKATRDFTYVSDTVEGYIKTIKNKKCIGETINLGTGYDFSIKKTVDLISSILNKNITVISDKKRIRPKKSEVNRLVSDNKKALKILNWKPIYSRESGFKEGLKKTVEWFTKKENLKHYKSNLYNL